MQKPKAAKLNYDPTDLGKGIYQVEAPAHPLGGNLRYLLS